MSDPPAKPTNILRWRLEYAAHWLVEVLAGWLPGRWVFRMGEVLGGMAWHVMPLRRQMVLRNLRIAFGAGKDLPELRRMARATMRRSGGNLISAAHTARLTPEQLGRVIEVEHLELLEEVQATGKGVVLLLAHMGNWELLSRLIHFFPPGSRAGAFYRPLNNPLLNERILARRQADGTRMFSKHDNPLQVAGFLREGGIVGILADQRVSQQGEVARFFGRPTLASPLPSLLARRAKCAVLALSLRSVAPGRWRVCFHPVQLPPTTAHCVEALECVMKTSPLDVFWLQERWKTKARALREWLAHPQLTATQPHRLLWCLPAGIPAGNLPAGWQHPGVIHEVVDCQSLAGLSAARLRQRLIELEDRQSLPFDCVLAAAPPAPDALGAACRALGIRFIMLPAVDGPPPPPPPQPDNPQPPSPDA